LQLCKQIVGEIFEGYIFKEKFKPIWLNDTLDLYNDELKIAIEYYDIKHYKYCNRIHKSLENFTIQQEKDRLKKQLCEENSIKLIIIDDNYSSKDIIRNYIVDQLFIYNRITFNKTKINTQCIICFDDFTINSLLYTCPVCIKPFHKDCISEWFNKCNNYKCPHCRNEN
jgi:hypothetical protein